MESEKDYYPKYLKYKHLYLELKKQWEELQGGVNSSLEFYRIGEKKYKFKFNKVFDIGEGTSAIFLGNDMIVITRPGEIFRIANYQNSSKISITKIHDMREEVRDRSDTFTSEDLEQGLLGIAALHNKIYLAYTTGRPDLEGTNLFVDEYDYVGNNLTYRQNIIGINFPTTYHHGGHLVLGPDQKLYLGVGDGGPQNDPNNVSQDPKSLKGKLIRIDPATHAYEIVAMGLRQPWLFSFDDRNRIWIGDVGWNTSESIDLIPDFKKKYNFGWSYYEGSVLNKKGPYKFEDFDPPIWEYPTDNKTGRSVIGGYFLPELNIYVFGDYLGFMRAIELVNGIWKEVGNNKMRNYIYSLEYDGKNIYILSDNAVYQLEIIPK